MFLLWHPSCVGHWLAGVQEEHRLSVNAAMHYKWVAAEAITKYTLREDSLEERSEELTLMAFKIHPLCYTDSLLHLCLGSSFSIVPMDPSF